MFYLYKLLIFFICFEEVISRLIFPLKYCKYLIVFAVLFAVLHKNEWRFSFPIKTFFGKLFLLITVYSTLVSIPFFVQYGWNGFDVPKKYLFFPILVICFFYAPLFGCSAKSLLYFYARIMLLYSVSNAVLYFLNLPIWNSGGYWGRISVGYPTIDVVSYAIAIAIFMFGNKNQNWFKNSFASFVLSLGIISQVSGTGFILLAMIVSYAIVFIIWDKVHGKSNNLGKKMILLFVLMGVFLPIGYAIIDFKRPDLLKKMEWHLINRTSLIIQGNAYSTDVNTMDVRKDEYKIAQKEYQNDAVSMFLGVGFGPLNFSSTTNNEVKKTVFLESQYHLTLFTSGLLGVAILLLLFASVVWKTLCVKNRLMFSITTFFIAAFWTVNPLMSFSLAGVLSLCYVLIFYRDETGQNNPNCL